MALSAMMGLLAGWQHIELGNVNDHLVNGAIYNGHCMWKQKLTLSPLVAYSCLEIKGGLA